MFTESIWNAFPNPKSYPVLKENISTDTLIIGGGVTGITLGMQLANKGKECIVLEARKVGGGTTSHSTGNLYVTIDAILSTLGAKYDAAVVQHVTMARQAALNQIKSNVAEYQLECDFENTPWYLYATDKDKNKVEKEFETATEIGLAMQRADMSLIPYNVSSAITLPDQAQINPLKYVQLLAAEIDQRFCRIFEDSPAMKIEKNKGGLFEISTPEGKIIAKHLVHATHTPKGFSFLQTLLGPYREYGIACQLKQRIDLKGIFWGYHNDEKYSTRTYEINGKQYLLIIGKAHKVGQMTHNEKNILELENFAREHFEVSTIDFRWGGQHYRPADMLPFIGATEDNLYVATGYATDGLVYGTLAGMMISDQISGKENQWTELFDPKRINPLKSASNFIKENINVAAQYLDLIPGFEDDKAFVDMVEGTGKVIDKDGHKLAVYRNYDKKLIVKSAVCTHLACVVHFNNAEKTWDCPCHGSRFGIDGSVLEGPALLPLHEITGMDGKVKIL